MNDNGRADSVPIRVLGIGGSTRRGSKSLVLLQSALRELNEAGAETTLADVRELDLPIYDDDLPLASYPPSLHALLAATRDSDAFVFCSPTYHGTVSGAVKNALDALNFLFDDEPRYLGGKPVALLALGGGGAANVLNSLHHAARALNGLTIPTTVIASGRAIQEGSVIDDAVTQRLRTMASELIDLTVRLRPAPDLAERY
jgi:FMN reductase